jgi:hypothetical protein
MRGGEADELATRAWYYAASAASAPADERLAKAHKKPQPKKQQAASSSSEMASDGGVDADLFDFDCNLTHADLKDDVHRLMETAAGVGVREMLVPGATLDESRAAIALCATLPSVSCMA